MVWFEDDRMGGTAKCQILIHLLAVVSLRWPVRSPVDSFGSRPYPEKSTIPRPRESNRSPR